jgi:hypothetical protein
MGIDAVTHNQPFFRYIFSIISLSFRVATPPGGGIAFVIKRNIPAAGVRSPTPKLAKTVRLNTAVWRGEGRKRGERRERRERRELRELRERRVGYPDRLGINSQANSSNHLKMIGEFVRN